MTGAYTSIINSIYLDNHASTPMDPRVMEAMEPFYYLQAANPHSGDHALGWEASKAVAGAAFQIAQTIGSDSDEIIFTSGATEANNMAILGLLGSATPERRRILVSAIEHKSVLAASMAAVRRGLIVERIPVDEQGVVDLQKLVSILSEDVLLVSVMAVNNEIGSIQPLREIGRATKAVGALFHTDASQALVTDAIDVWNIGADLLSLSAHKIYGPKGIGCIYINRNLHSQIEPLMFGGDQQEGIRPGTIPVPLCVGFGAAVSLLARPEFQDEKHRIRRLRDLLVEQLLSLRPDICLNGPPLGQRHPGNASVQFGALDAREILTAAQPALAASTGSACTSGIPEPSHVLRAIGLSHSQAEATVRFGLGRFNTESDVDLAVETIAGVLERLL